MSQLLKELYQEVKSSDSKPFDHWPTLLKYFAYFFFAYTVFVEVIHYLDSAVLGTPLLIPNCIFLGALFISHRLSMNHQHNCILFFPALVSYFISIGTFTSYASSVPTWFFFQALGLFIAVLFSDLRRNLVYGVLCCLFPVFIHLKHPEITHLKVLLEQNFIYFGVLAACAFSHFRTMRRREESKQNESALLIKKSSDLGVWQWNLETNEVTYDDRWLEMLGYQPNELPPGFETWEKNVHPKDKNFATKQIESYLSGKSSEYELKFRMKHKSGHWVPIIAKGKIVSRDNEGNPLFFSGTHFDLSKIERLETIASKNARLASLGKIASGIGHEINNPLAIIKGYSYLIQKSQDQTDVQLQGHFDKMNNAIERIKNITQAIREFSKDDNEKYECLDLSEVMGSSVSLLSDIYTTKGVVIQNLCNIEKPVFVNANRGKIQQVILHLLSNAVDATKETKDPEVKIYSSLEGQEVKIHIQDNGAGINEEIQPQIFDPFFSTKEVNTGTGIGLSLSHEIIKNHNGEISYTSISGKGSTFTFVLPIAQQTAIEAA